jgi:hypothetical protein
LGKPVLDLLVKAVFPCRDWRHTGLENHVDVEVRQLLCSALHAFDGLFHVFVRQSLDGQGDCRDVDAVRHHLIPFTDWTRRNGRRKDDADVQSPSGDALGHTRCSI